MGANSSKPPLTFDSVIEAPTQVPPPDERDLRRKRRAEHMETAAEDLRLMRTKLARLPHLQRLHHDLPIEARRVAATRDNDIEEEGRRVAAARLRPAKMHVKQAKKRRNLQKGAIALNNELAQLSWPDKMTVVSELSKSNTEFPALANILTPDLLRKLSELRKMYSYTEYAEELDPRFKRSRLYFDMYLIANIKAMAKKVLRYKPCGQDVRVPFWARDSTQLDQPTTTRTPEQIASILADTTELWELMSYNVDSLRFDLECGTSLYRTNTIPVIATLVIKVHGGAPTRSFQRRNVALNTTKVPSSLFVARIGHVEHTVNVSAHDDFEPLLENVKRLMDQNSNPAFFADGVEDLVNKNFAHAKQENSLNWLAWVQTTKGNLPVIDANKKKRFTDEENDCIYRTEFIIAETHPQMKYFLPGELMMNKTYSYGESDPWAAVQLIIPGQDNVDLLKLAGDKKNFDLSSILNFITARYAGLTHLIIVDLSCQRLPFQGFAARANTRALLGGR